MRRFFAPLLLLPQRKISERPSSFGRRHSWRRHILLLRHDPPPAPAPAAVITTPRRGGTRDVLSLQGRPGAALGVRHRHHASTEAGGRTVAVVAPPRPCDRPSRRTCRSCPYGRRRRCGRGCQTRRPRGRTSRRNRRSQVQGKEVTLDPVSTTSPPAPRDRPSSSSSSPPSDGGTTSYALLFLLPLPRPLPPPPRGSRRRRRRRRRRPVVAKFLPTLSQSLRYRQPTLDELAPASMLAGARGQQRHRAQRRSSSPRSNGGGRRAVTRDVGRRRCGRRR